MSFYKAGLNLKYKLVLGSSSPRRRELLRSFGLPFEIIKPDVVEVRAPNETPEQYVTRNALEKVQWVFKNNNKNDIIVISADTVVVIDQMILEKPTSTADAKRMLQLLSARSHEVFTGVAVATYQKSFQSLVQSTVYFKKLSQEEIDWYVQTHEPLDKAGAYAAQGVGAYMIRSIQGSYTNVVGLPLAEVWEILKNNFCE